MPQRQSSVMVNATRANLLSTAPSSGWAIVDADGLLVARDLPNRAAAVRRLGHFAVAPHPLPLHVVAPSGEPSGDTIG
jgi:D-serine deaminase-like pyridoxal phosphate-dependent protein